MYCLVRVWFIPFLACLLSHAGVQADTINTIAIDNPNGFVIASDANNPDAGYDREAVQVFTEVTHTFPGSTGSHDYRYSFQLLNESGSAQLIETESGGTGTRYDLDGSIFFLSGSDRTVTRSVDLVPQVVLDPYQQYRIRVTVFYVPTKGNDSVLADELGSLQPLIHFAGTNPNDTALNVIAFLQGEDSSNPPNVHQRYLVDTIPSKNAAKAELRTLFYRYDNYDESTSVFNTVNFSYDYVLKRTSDDAEIPLESNSVSSSIGLAWFAATTPKSPYTRLSFPLTVELQPSGGARLSHDESYYLEVTVSHVEVPGASPTERTGNTVETDPHTFLHFNGALFFGTGGAQIETTVNAIDSAPTATGSASGGLLPAELAVSTDGGAFVTNSDVVFGDGTALPVELDTDGNSFYTGSTAVAVTPSGVSNQLELNGIDYSLSAPELTTSGLQAGIFVRMPAGTGIAFNTAFGSGTNFLAKTATPTAYGQSLEPLQSDVSLQAFGTALFEENTPVVFTFDSINWDTAGGTIDFNVTGQYYRSENQLNYLETNVGLLENPTAVTKPSNERYYRYASVAAPTVTLSTINGVGRLDVSFNLSAGDMFAHFPKDTEISWTGGTLELDNGQPVPSVSQLSGVSVSTYYRRDCADDETCGGGNETSALILSPAGGNLTFTPDGGLRGSGLLSTAHVLKWGKISSSQYAHETGAFSVATFCMPGHFIEAAGLGGLETDQGPGAILLSGVDDADTSLHERPETAAYENGLGDYAGFNFRVPGSGFNGKSSLAGTTQTFSLTSRSKYYARAAGVTGIHEAQPGSFPPSLVIYGYPFNFSNYGLSFLDSRNEDSRTNGDLSVPFPSDFTQPFEELTLTCLGALDEALPPEDDVDKTLGYWLANFSTLAIGFEPDAAAPCNLAGGFLALGVRTSPANLSDALYGRLGFLSDGNLLAPSDGQGDLDSRFALPSNTGVQGPSEEVYAVNPVSKLYYNNYRERPADGSGSITGTASDPDSFEAGFISFAGGLDVPFFEALQAQIHTSASETANAPVYVMGGWPTQGWTVSGEHFFNQADFDANHRSFPNVVGLNVDDYRNQSSTVYPEYRVRARQDWLGVVQFDYPLEWSPVNRSFRSPENVENDLLVLNVEHRVDYLSPENAELIFGAEYDGLPQLNLSSAFFEAVDGQIGFSEKLSGEATDAVFGQLNDGVDRLHDMLDDRMNAFFDRVFEQAIDPKIEALVDELETRLGPVSDTYFLYEAEVASLKSDVATVKADLLDALRQMDQGIGQATGVIEEIDASLAEIQYAVAIARNQVVTLPADVGGTGEAVEGLLYKDLSTDQRKIVRNLITLVAGDDLGGLVGSVVDEPLNELLEEAQPTLEQIDGYLAEVEALLEQIRTEALDPTGEFFKDVEARFADLSTQAETEIIDPVFDDIFAFLDSLPTTNARFDEYGSEELKALIRESFENHFYASPILQSVQIAIKQRIYDIETQVRGAIDGVFAEVRMVAAELIGTVVGGPEESINEFLGEIGEKIGSGRIDGYAHINNDALRELRIDGRFEMEVDKPIGFNGFLHIYQLDSDGQGGCGLGPGAQATEVKFGTVDQSLDWISPDMRATITAKFSFENVGETSPSILGFGGGFEMTGGSIGFESFEINTLSAVLAASRLSATHPDAPGIAEAYIGASVGMKFSSFEVFGGVFFGRTCSIAPLEVIDPLAANLLGDPPFTGGYVYGEGWVPILGSGCVFNVSIGAGAGVFYFLDGPTFGGKLLGGVSGEALCILSVRGEVLMVGVKQPDGFAFGGRGEVTGKLGACPFCVKKTVSVEMMKQGDSWDIEL
jgi:hypothetical protein